MLYKPILVLFEPTNNCISYIYCLYICIYKVVISVYLSDHNSETPIPICLKFLLGNSEDGFEVLSLGRLLSGKIAKTVFYDNARVNSGTNYDSLGPLWVMIILGFLVPILTLKLLPFKPPFFLLSLKTINFRRCSCLTEIINAEIFSRQNVSLFKSNQLFV